jgi:PIN domain nuclease of toxin-antitoxin system
LDASAVLTLVHREPGWEEVRDVLSTAVVSAVNAAEVCGKLAEWGVDASRWRSLFERLGVDVIPFDGEQAKEAARLRPLTKNAGLSLGDRACLAAAQVRDATAVTADRGWAGLKVPVEIVVVR